MKKPFKIFTIDAGCYDYSITVCISEDYLRVCKIFNKRFSLPDENDTAFFPIDFKRTFGRFTCIKEVRPILWIPKPPKTSREFGTLAHEALHATIAITRWYGVKLARESEEAFAHLHSHLIKQILRKINLEKS